VTSQVWDFILGLVSCQADRFAKAAGDPPAAFFCRNYSAHEEEIYESDADSLPGK
jgi:hypothetical protein